MNGNLSSLWSLNLKDVFKGLLSTVYGALLTYAYGVFAGLYELVKSGQPYQLQISWKDMLVIGIFAGLSYLTTRYTSDSKGDFLGKN